LSETDLDALYTACAPAAFRRARGLLGNDADAWDVVHEVFCKIAEGDLFDPLRSRPMAYVHKATTNACLNHLAARRTRARADPGAVTAHEGHSEALVARDLLAKLDLHLDDLDRRLLVLAFHDGLPQEQIAEVLGVWRRTVGRRLARLRTLVEGLDAQPLKKTS
jgi:RNA polymerase sigma factor (sigma-70 family)